ncbi:hypothetical protein HU200_034077 [Digitaria exilis]|uniref:Serine protease n=1 Tax=Digitaria exilis TaxID=1010633 RepID=A0A835BQJ9_9POAL|nr:hypothetical protein HU200_034077 [Digitaria exilis]
MLRGTSAYLGREMKGPDPLLRPARRLPSPTSATADRYRHTARGRPMEGGMKTNPNRLVYSKAMNARSSVVQVIVRRKSDHSVRRGTGFVIQERHHALGVTSLVLTCEHVVRVNPGETGVTMWVRRALQGGGVQELPATVKAFDAFTDVALLIVPGLKGETRRPRLGLTFTASPGNVGDCAIATGYCNPKYRVTAHVRLPAISPGSMRYALYALTSIQAKMQLC